MEIRAIAKQIRMSPRKVRLLADMVRKMSIENAISALESTPKRAALPVTKTLKSAIANAVNNAGLSKESLSIESITVTEGPALKRFHPSTRGRVHPYKRRTSNIRIVLKAKEAVKAQSVKKEETKKDETKTDKKKEAKGGKVKV